MELDPLLSQFGRDRRLALRVEHVPSRARLSRGRNNGDHSWSLTRDELPGLLYLPAKGMDAAHTLAIRIISLDSDGGSTLAVHQYPILATNTQEETAATSLAESPDQAVEVRRLRAELEEERNSLREREFELIEAREALEQARTKGSPEKLQAELTAARMAWKADLDKRLAGAAAEAAATIKKDRAAWQAEMKAQISGADARAREQFEDELAAAQSTWKAELDKRLQRAATEAAAALEKSRATWQAETKNRLAAAEDRARKQIEQTRAETAGHPNEETELRRLRHELSTTQSTISRQENELTEAQSSMARMLERGKRDTDAAVSMAEINWKEGEAVRLAAAETKWQQQSARARAEAAAQIEKLEGALAEGRSQAVRDRRDSAETRRLRNELDATQATLAQRDTDLAEAQSAAQEARERAKQQLEVALSEAEQTWKAEEAARLAAAEAHWRQQSTRALADATNGMKRAEAALADLQTEAKSGRDRRDTAELRRLRTEFAATRTTLAEREAELAEAQLAAGRAREQSRQEIDAALLKAEEAWKASEAIRLAEFETQERERSAMALAEAVARLERTESALKEARDRIDTMRDPANEAEIQRLRAELAALQVAQSDRESEAGQARSSVRQARERWVEQSRIAMMRAEEAWRAEEAQRLETARRQWERDARLTATMGPASEESVDGPVAAPGHLFRDAGLAALLGVVAVAMAMYYPNIREFLSSAPQQSRIEPTNTAAAHAQLSKPGQSAALHAIVTVASANVRAAPSKTSSVVATLPRNTSVTPGERNGAWVQVRIAGQDGKPSREGWMFGAVLKDTTGP